MRKIIGWIEEDGAKAFLCWREESGQKFELEIISISTKPPHGGPLSGKSKPVPIRIAA